LDSFVKEDAADHSGPGTRTRPVTKRPVFSLKKEMYFSPDVTLVLHQSEAVKIQYGRPNQPSPPIRTRLEKWGKGGSKTTLENSVGDFNCK